MLYSGMSWSVSFWLNASVWVMTFWLWVIMLGKDDSPFKGSK